MTKESKLALIIGFVLVLVVGVLVSDHFSQANKMSHDTLEPGDVEVATPIASLGARDVNAINSIPQNRADLNQPVRVPVEISNRDPRGANTGSSILDRIHDAARSTDLPVAAEVKERDQPLIKPARIHQQKLPEPKTTNYTVTTGDSLIRIARRMLGDGERWREIEALNADKLGPDLILKIGMTLKLPSDAKIVSVGSDTNKSYTHAGGSSYIVKTGDTLGEIASDQLGSSKRMNEIVELNGLESANKIYVGMELKIPAR